MLGNGWIWLDSHNNPLKTFSMSFFFANQQQKHIIYKIVPIKRKRRVKMYEKRGGQAHPFLRIHFWVRYWTLGMLGNCWTWLDSHNNPLNPFVCPFLQFSNKNTLYARLFQSREKDRSKCMKRGGGRLLPPQNTFLGSILDFRHAWKWLDLVGFTQ